jgi:hypothetical protein
MMIETEALPADSGRNDWELQKPQRRGQWLEV